LKTYNSILLTAFLLFTTATSALARLGETEAEIEARYGNGHPGGPRFPNTTQMKYRKDGYEIVVHYLDGKSVMEQFKQTSKEMTDKEIAEFIKTFSAGVSWTYSPREKTWYHDKRKISAHREIGHSDWLWIENRDVMKQFEKNKPSGF
jgi:hypothetical protein